MKKISKLLSIMFLDVLLSCSQNADTNFNDVWISN